MENPGLKLRDVWRTHGVLKDSKEEKPCKGVRI